MSPGKPAPEELPLLEEGDLESPAQLSHASLPPVADLPMPAEADARRVVSQVGLSEYCRFRGCALHTSLFVCSSLPGRARKAQVPYSVLPAMQSACPCYKQARCTPC